MSKITKAWKVVRVTPHNGVYKSCMITSGLFSLSYSKKSKTSCIGDNLIFCFKTRGNARHFRDNNVEKHLLRVCRCEGEFVREIRFRSAPYYVRNALISTTKFMMAFDAPPGTIGFKWIKLL